MPDVYGGAGEVRTPDLRFRKPTLYPSELQPRPPHCSMRRRAAATSSCATRIPVNTTSLCYYPLSIRLRRPPTPSQTPLEVPVSSKLKWIGIVIVAILVILIVVPFLIPINNFKPTIESKASDALGRMVQVCNLSFSLLTESFVICNDSVTDYPKFNS